jgi:ABC-type transport system involved in multi-copper enzyme maturation permease subunit
MSRTLVIARLVWLDVLRRKDLYVLFILLGALLFALMSVNIFGLGGVVRYITDLGFLLAWLFSWILSISVATRQLPQEEQRRTIFPLLAKPLMRWELLAGKWLGAWTVASVAVLAFYLAITLVAFARGGRLQPATWLQALGLHFALLAILSALAVALSTRESQGAAATLCYVLAVAAYGVVPRLAEFAMQASGLRLNAMLFLHYALPHFELFDMRQRLVHDWGPAPWSAWLQIMAYGALWVAILLLAAWLGYRNKHFRRGAVE